MQRPALLYDKKGDYHYDLISAFIKSVRGSDPDAAIYWMARMLEGGEDPKFIARRLIILASEDIGNADPQALVLATSAFTAVDYVGMPEAEEDDEPFGEKMERLTAELRQQMAQATKLDKLIWANLEDIGYGG